MKKNATKFCLTAANIVDILNVQNEIHTTIDLIKCCKQFSGGKRGKCK